MRLTEVFRCFFSSFSLSVLFMFLSAINSIAIELTAVEEAYLAQNPIIKVHNEKDWPPFNFYENDKPQGISVDVIKRIASLTGLQIEFVTGPSWSEFLDMMDNKSIDVMLNIVDLPERRNKFQFTTEYAKSLTGIFTTSENSGIYFDFSDLYGKTVAIPSGFDLEITVPKYHPQINVLLVEDIISCIEAVRSGDADAFMEEIGVVDYITSQNMVLDVRLSFQVEDDPFVSNLNIATTHENDILHGILQKGLNAIPGQELNEIRKKWLLQAHEIYERNMVNLSVAEKEYLYKDRSVSICVDPSWPPLDFIDESGNHSGLAADLINKLASRLGVTLNLIPTNTWEDTLNFVEHGYCEVIPLMNETDKAREYMDFSQAYFNFATVIATRDDASFIGGYSELYGKKVALQSYFFITEFIREHHPQIEIVEVENTEAALKLVSEQKVFATIDGLPTIVNTIEKLALENVKIVGSVPQENQMKLGIRKGNDVLLSIFEKGIASLTEKEKIGLYKKWFDIEVSNEFYNKSFIIKVIAGLCVVLLFLLWRQLTLSAHTKKLKTLNAKLKHSATVDHLTQVLNRKAIEKNLENEIEKSKLTNESLSLVICDVDYFKVINDSFGHLKGDNVLKKLAEIVSDSIRKDDHFGRWGGEEFLIILPNTDHENAEKVIKNLQIELSVADFEMSKPVTLSFGLGQYKNSETVASFISRVDDCLYEAKRRGRNHMVNAEKETTACD